MTGIVLITTNLPNRDISFSKSITNFMNQMSKLGSVQGAVRNHRHHLLAVGIQIDR